MARVRRSLNQRSARWSGLLVLCSALVVASSSAELVSAATSAESAEPPFVEIEVLSNRADLVSDGDALVAIHVPASLPQALEVTVHGRDVTSSFARQSDGVFRGLVTGLRVGANVLQAELPDGRGARMTITNHPNAGPVFSGPHRQPWTCQADAVDEGCNQPPRYNYLYQPEGSNDLEPYDPTNPPDDVATTTTDQGKTVPFIVQQEIGYQARSQYKILVLFDPTKELDEQFDPTNPSTEDGAWNHKIYIPHGGGCGSRYGAGEAPLTSSFGDQGNEATAYSYVTALGRGFAVLSTALENAGSNCDLPLQAESLVMAKERIVEVYGPIRYTIGAGCSGGSLVPQQVANAYPGIYQGLVVTCSFPDFWSSLIWFQDIWLFWLYLQNPESALALWTPTAIDAAAGMPISDLAGNNVLLNHAQRGGVDPRWNELGLGGCSAVTKEQTYDPETNPRGIRCSAADWSVDNMMGRRTPDVWTDVERAINQGFAGRAWGNAGVLYGLNALRDGDITAEQFVDLNSLIGSTNIDWEPIPDRSHADQPALENVYRSGSVNDAVHLDQVAIINGLGPNDGIYAHPPSGAIQVRARLDAAFGHQENHVLWDGPQTIFADIEFYNNGLIAMDRWLAEVEADESDMPLSAKIINNRPEDIRDACFDGLGHQMGFYGDPGCPFVPIHSTPRQAAGAPPTDAVIECRLKPLVRDEIPATMTDAQWARLSAAYPDGICDYSKPGVSQEQQTVTWQTYLDADGQAILGGAAMPPPPASVPFGPSAATAAPEVTPPTAPLPATGGGAMLLAFAALCAAWLLRRLRETFLAEPHA